MIKLSADYIYPVSSPPVKNGVLVLDDNGTILDVLPENASDAETQQLSGILCPGFINTHCHLELSHLRGKIKPGNGLIQFVKDLQSIRAASEELTQKAIQEAESEMISNGIVAVGDISNGSTTFKTKTRSKLYYHTFLEVFGFEPQKAEGIFQHALELKKQYREIFHSSRKKGSVSIAPHSPYSVSTELFQKINAYTNKHKNLLTMHNQETAAENRFFREKSGPFVSLFQHFGMNTTFWTPPGTNSLSTVLPYFPGDQKFLLVHNTYSGEPDIQAAQAYSNNVYWCFCPNANKYIENRLPEFPLFIENNAKITLGTDSIASNWSLSIWDEVKTVHANAPEISLETLLTWATKNGAEFLGIEKTFGSFEKGKRPGVNLIEGIDFNDKGTFHHSTVRPVFPESEKV